MLLINDYFFSNSSKLKSKSNIEQLKCLDNIAKCFLHIK